MAMRWQSAILLLPALLECTWAADTSSSYSNSTQTSNASPITTSSASGIWTVPATGNGSSYDWGCNSEWSNYTYLASSGGFGGHNVTSTYLATQFTASTTQLCDGHNRIIGTLTPTASSTFTTVDYAFLNYTGPPPSCTIAPPDCTSMWDQYNSAVSSFSSMASVYFSTRTDSSAPVPGGITVDLPQCSQTALPTTTGVTTSYTRNMCATTLGASTVCPYGQVVSNYTAAGAGGQATGACEYMSATQSSVPDSGPSVVSNGQTYYENKAYISYQTAYASNSCGRIGNTYAGGVVGLPSSSVYSISGYHGELYDYAYQVNFADFIHPIPASAYYAMAQCTDSGNIKSLGYPNMVNNKTLAQICRDPGYLIYDGLFAPELAVPPAFRDLDPAWSNCLLSLNGLWDPPKALQPVSTEAGPTTPGQGNTATSSATPAQSPETPATTTTGIPVTTTLPPIESQVVGSGWTSSQGNTAPAAPSSTANVGDVIASIIAMSGKSATETASAQGSGNGNSQPQANTGTGTFEGPAVIVSSSQVGSSAGSGGIATAAGQVFSVDPANTNGVIVAGQTLTPGDATVISGAQVSVATGVLVVNGSSVSIAPAASSTSKSSATTGGSSSGGSGGPQAAATVSTNGAGPALLPANVLLSGLVGFTAITAMILL
ncbi:hypothetical protein LTR78_010164 [Recurvomyces mirabilis]|uniref:Uncharacterized protein n=1 Tax=Recurvomyces mirabilis TaxID=574656 RepID=A0AAE0TMX0_9PEZI|nr:hypothetical protein LTR78_010164 [Recurvomyces mirabilis]KAK5149955.1 hypothetical protein LTS14_010560 [Recurvomyces mirabilis]